MTAKKRSLWVRIGSRVSRLWQRARSWPRTVAFRARNRRSGGLPIPPGRLIHLVAGTPDVFWFLESGARAAQSIRELLAKNGLRVEKFGSILDFGCGVGRVIRYWSALQGPTIYGTDYNLRLAAWCRKHLPFARIQTNDLMGPLGYANASFDFIYALSVFTHLTEAQQLYWIEELMRVLRPGGYLPVTVHGNYYQPQLTPAEQAQLANGQLVVRQQEAAGTNFCAAFHPPAYMREKLAKNWVLVDFVPEGARGNPYQDAYLLRKPPA